MLYLCYAIFGYVGFITMSGGLIQDIAIWDVGLISEQWGIRIGFSSMILYMIIGSLSLMSIILLEKHKYSHKRLTSMESLLLHN